VAELSQAGCPSCHPTNSIKALKDININTQTSTIFPFEYDDNAVYAHIIFLLRKTAWIWQSNIVNYTAVN